MASNNGKKNWWDECRSYKLAYEDVEFLHQDELRPVRLQLELLKPEMILRQNNIKSTIVVYGGTRILEKKEAKKRVDKIRAELKDNPNDSGLLRNLKVAESILRKSSYYDEAMRFASIVSRESQMPTAREYVIVTGGGPGIMEAANRGAYESGAMSIGFNITLPMEQYPNDYVTHSLCFRFHYFALRKMHFLMRAKALVAFPGGYGTMDELFEALTLVQTNKVQALPIILFGTEYWKKMIDFDFMVDEGVIDPPDLNLFKFADTAEQAWQIIRDFYYGEEKTPVY